MNHTLFNRTTQPPQRFRVFNRGDVLPRAWYWVCRSTQLPPRGVLSVTIGAQRLAVFRTEAGRVCALDAYCPHMGTDLGLGSVVGDHLRCHFHHWKYAGDGRCVEIPCQPGERPTAAVRGYACEEKYGSVWIFPDRTPDVPLIEIPGLEGRAVRVAFDSPNVSASPHHVSMVNGLDAQHLRTVHDIGLEMTLRSEEGPAWMDFVLEGEIPVQSLFGRWARWWLGPRYAYAMRYAQASVAALVLMRGVYFRRPAWRWPELYMLFAYRPLPEGGSITQPIFVAEETPGLWGALKAWALLLAVRVAYRALEEDDQRIYDNIRFQAKNLLTIDAPVARYIQYVEKLPLSDWSAPEAR
jgi:phenylpropionate dioxygenase-like ring-hydroxylating dioxygenase large terminal subunit